MEEAVSPNKRHHGRFSSFVSQADGPELLVKTGSDHEGGKKEEKKLLRTV